MLEQTRLKLAHTAEAGYVGMGMRALYGDVEEFARQHIGGAIEAT